MENWKTVNIRLEKNNHFLEEGKQQQTQQEKNLNC
jgi:hypothetical protein